MIDRRNEVYRALAKELLLIQQGSKDDAIALLEDGDYFFTEEEMEQIVIHIEDLAEKTE
jgi:hypothetical protein